MAMAMQAKELLRPLTYEDLEAYDDDRHRYEIIFGELVVSPSAAPNHADVLMRLILAFGVTVEKRQLGHLLTAPVDLELPANNIVVPDMLFITSERLRIEKNHLVAAPELVLEVVSPSSRTRDYISKRVMYEHAGVNEYWIVDPMKRTVDVLDLVDERYVQTENQDGVARSAVVPGVAIDVAQLFAKLLR
jgi:Uma2 family endonuclease